MKKYFYFKAAFISFLLLAVTMAGCGGGSGGPKIASWKVVGNPGFSVGQAEYTSIAIDGYGVPYVVYHHNGGDNGIVYKATVMKFDGANWVPVGSPGFSAGETCFTSIAIDGNGVLYVVYQDGVDEKPQL